MRGIDLTDQKFGLLKCIKRVEDHIEPNGRKIRMWLCECECGRCVTVNTGNLRSGHITSCGCKRVDVARKKATKHGQRKSRLYQIFATMKKRCYVPTSINFSNYGGRGIKICEEWLNDFQAFYDWAMANGYADNLTIDRINNDGNYEPSNCQWITRSENSKKSIIDRRKKREKDAK